MRFNANENPVEPSADIRQMALLHASLFVAHLEQGFSEEQALALTMFVCSQAIDDEDYE